MPLPTTCKLANQTLPWASSCHVTAQQMSPRRIRSPMPTFSAKKLSTSTKGRDFPFLSAQFLFSCHCDGSLVWRPGFKPCLGQAVPSTAKQQSHDHRIDVPTTRTLSYDCICCQEALDWRKWTKGGCSFPFLSAQFDRQVMVGQWLLTGANEKKLDAASPSCLRSFNRAVIPSVSSM